MARVYMPRPLVAIIPNLPKLVDLEAETVLELIAALEDRWPGIQIRLCAANDRIREHINIFVDGEPATLAMPVRANSVVRILTAVSGG